MNILAAVLVLAVIPLVIHAVVAGLSYLGERSPGERPAPYTLGEPWTAPPVLWSATDEQIVSPGAHHDQTTGHTSDVIGGRAYGSF